MPQLCGYTRWFLKFVEQLYQKHRLIYLRGGQFETLTPVRNSKTYGSSHENPTCKTVSNIDYQLLPTCIIQYA